jgi:UBX domain-containing protein 1
LFSRSLPKLTDRVFRHIPRELEAEARNAVINVNLVDNSAQDYVAPKPVLKPFVGAGHALGSSAAPAAAPAPAAAAAPPGPALDSGKPTTSLQLRLADGTRLVARFNTDHTVAHVRQFVDAARPGGASRPYVLQTSMPVKQLTDTSQTLQAAGLLNATIIQKYI